MEERWGRQAGEPAGFRGQTQEGSSEVEQACPASSVLCQECRVPFRKPATPTHWSLKTVMIVESRARALTLGQGQDVEAPRPTAGRGEVMTMRAPGVEP